MGVLRNDVGSGIAGDAGEERTEAPGEESVGEGSSYSLLATTQMMWRDFLASLLDVYSRAGVRAGGSCWPSRMDVPASRGGEMRSFNDMFALKKAGTADEYGQPGDEDTRSFVGDSQVQSTSATAQSILAH